LRCGVLAFDLNQTDTIARAGYDCAELSASAVMNIGNAEFKSAKRRLTDSGLCFDTFYEPLPPDIWICTEGFNTFTWREYLKDVCYRTSELGGSRFVFSNGGGRSIPYDGDLPRARELVMTFIRMLCDVAYEYGITVILEPLDKSLSNMYNTLDECANLIRILGKSNLTSMCGSQYFSSSGPEDILKNQGIISHIHLDSPILPQPHSLTRVPQKYDGYDYKPFFKMLRQIKYDGLVSVTAGTNSDFEGEIAGALTFLRDNFL